MKRKKNGCFSCCINANMYNTLKIQQILELVGVFIAQVREAVE